MHVGFSIGALNCQPLRNFGKTNHSKNQSNVSSPAFAPAFSSANTVSREEYDKLNAKYELACRLAVAQAEQYKKYVAAHPAK